MTALAVAREKRAKQAINWMFVLSVFAIAVVCTQIGIWEYDRIQARKLALSAIPAKKVWRSCGEVRAAGVAPLFHSDPGYNRFLDADGDGVACEPHISNSLRNLRWWLWQSN